jgi:hypothetical protein
MQNSEPYDNPFWEKSNRGGEREEKKCLSKNLLMLIRKLPHREDK